MQKLAQEITSFQSDIPQEIADKALFLEFMQRHGDCLLRSNRIAHFSASAWILNEHRDKVLMVYHNIYQSFSWTGGHADGSADLKALAMREAQEETGISALRPLLPDIFSLESLTVDGHIKNGAYVSSHLHLNVTYLFEASEAEALRANPSENSAVQWIPIAELKRAVSERWMYENIYHKLIEKVKIWETAHGLELSGRE